MTKNLRLRDSAVLFWLLPNESPAGSEAPNASPPPAPNPEPWWELHEAVRSAMETIDTHGKVPWIKTGDQVLPPDEIKRVYKSLGGFGKK